MEIGWEATREIVPGPGHFYFIHTFEHCRVLHYSSLREKGTCSMKFS